MVAPVDSYQLSWLGRDALSLVESKGFNCWTFDAPAFRVCLTVDLVSYQC